MGDSERRGGAFWHDLHQDLRTPAIATAHPAARDGIAATDTRVNHG